MAKIVDERGWPMREAQLKELMGLPKKLGKGGVPLTVIQGISVWVIPAPEPRLRADGRRVKVSTHRVMCKCPDCGTTASVGRLAQHRC